jgi:hypothetical protein
LATQRELLKAAGVTRIFSEKVSGVAARRPELEYVLDALEAGDLLVVTKLDRLARSTLDLLRRGLRNLGVKMSAKAAGWCLRTRLVNFGGERLVVAQGQEPGTGAHSKWTASQIVGCCGSVHSTRWRFLAGMKT